MRGSVPNRQRRGSVSPPRRSTQASYSSRARPFHPTSAIVTPPSSYQRPLRAQVLPAADAVPAPPLSSSAQSPRATSRSTTSNNSNRRAPRRASATTSSSITTRTTTLTTAASAAAAPLTPTSPARRRRLLQGFRPPSLLGLLNNTNPAPPAPTDVSPAMTSAARIKAITVRKHHVLQMNQRLHQHHSKRYSQTHADILSVLEFWRSSCPSEVTLKMLAFLGPSLILQLQRTQRHIYRLLQKQVSWRILCEELYKWKPGDTIPDSWHEHYRTNPCIPVDFTTIQAAIAVVGTGYSLKEYKRQLKQHQDGPEILTNLTIWLRPDYVHKLSRGVHIFTLRRTTNVTIRTMYTKQPQPQQPVVVSFEGSAEAPPECHPDSMNTAANREDDQDSESSGSWQEYDYNENDNDNDDDELVNTLKIPTRAIIMSQTIRHANEPLFRVTRGQLVLVDVNLKHDSIGVDIWNGNAAIHIQPTYLQPNNLIPNIPSASASLEQCWVQSSTGRGIVTVDGGHVSALHCCIRDCAGTGLYVGGRGTCATLQYTDVWSNGTGNYNGGIARGHSGIYIEQAKRVELTNSTVGYNTASGISLTNNTNAQPPVPANHAAAAPVTHNNYGLVMTHTAVLSNGCNPIDLPHHQGDGEIPIHPWLVGAAGAGAANDPDGNRIAAVGVPKAQSILLQEEMIQLKKEQQMKLIRMRRKRHKRRKQQQQSRTSSNRNS